MKIVLLATLLALTACSSAKVRILPGENGINRVVSKDRERDDAEEAAAKKANEYCEDQGKHMVVVGTDKTKYNGSMEEGTRKNVRNASKVAMILGGNGAAGGAVSAAGMSGYGMTNDRDYESSFDFKCK